MTLVLIFLKSRTYKIGDCVCARPDRRQREVFTLGVRELLVGGRIERHLTVAERHVERQTVYAVSKVPDRNYNRKGVETRGTGERFQFSRAPEEGRRCDIQLPPVACVFDGASIV
ncbi:hypothetical protein [Halorubrum kocurii]|uniref:hypothetical protein n=1 Tax=Halorubrum kocurii TaxID=478441 RepID=UPI0012682695|nr:hypothetical protein [Halorubrum kocurii]